MRPLPARTEAAERGDQQPVVVGGAGAGLLAAMEDRPLRAMDRAFDGGVVGPRPADAECCIPGGSEAFGAGTLAELVGGRTAHPARPGRRRNEPDHRQLLDEATLPIGRPAVMPHAGEGNGREGEQVVAGVGGRG